MGTHIAMRLKLTVIPKVVSLPKRTSKMLPDKLKILSKDLSSLINEDEITALAIETGYEVRESPLRGINFFLIHLLATIDKGMSSSLTELCNQGLVLGVEVAKESLNDRYTAKASLFMKRVCQLLMSKRLGSEVDFEVLQKFNGIFVSDSTSVEIPRHLCEALGAQVKGKSTSLLKLDCTFDLQSDWSRLWVRYGSSSDQTQIMGPPKNSLWIRDLGYYRTQDFSGIDYQGGKFISRARMDIPLYTARSGKQRVDLEQLIDRLSEDEFFEADVKLGYKRRFPARLVVQRVPDAIAEQKRKELIAQKRFKSRKLSDRRIKLCALNVFITNLEAKEWPASQIQQLYKIRWQIELIFKIWKSHLSLEKVPKMNKYRFECSLYAMLIYISLNHRMIQGLKNYYWNDLGIQLSEIKTAKMINVHIQKLIASLLGIPHAAEKFVQTLFGALMRYGKKEVRYVNKNPLFNTC